MLSNSVIPALVARYQARVLELTLRLQLYDAAKSAAASQGIKDFRISITHTSSSATAVVLAVKESS